MRIPCKPTLAALLLILTLTALAQEAGYWRASSQTARDITGDIAFSSDRSTDKISIDFLAFTTARIRTLTPEELDAAFNPDPGTKGAGSLYRLDIRATQKFLRKNTLCGSDDTKWMATYVSGRSLTVDFFSNDKPPVFTRQALADSSDLCGTYTYVR